MIHARIKHLVNFFTHLVVVASVYGCAGKADPKISTNFPYCAPACVWENNDNETIVPIIYKDTATGNFFYVESDGRHITAFSEQGRFLWQKNPFEDAHLWPYRVSKPVIVNVEDAQDVGKILIQFNSSQFGLLDKKTGEFIFGGQN